jgi:hypothetical protein
MTTTKRGKKRQMLHVIGFLNQIRDEKVVPVSEAGRSQRALLLKSQMDLHLSSFFFLYDTTKQKGLK